MLMYVQDLDGRIVYANRAACELVGKPPEEVVGKLPSELFDAVTVERWAEQNRQVLRDRPPDRHRGRLGRPHPPDPQDAGASTPTASPSR